MVNLLSSQRKLQVTKNAKVDGSRSLKINNRIDTDITFAKRKFLM